MNRGAVQIAAPISPAGGPTLARRVGRRGARVGMRRLVRGWVSALGFYGASAIAAAALIFTSLWGPPGPSARLDAGTPLDGAPGGAVFSGASWTRIDPGALDVRLVREAGKGAVTAVRLAAPTGEAAIAPGAEPARILITPDVGLAWRDRAIEVRVDTAPLTAITAERLAVGLQRAPGGPIEWLVAPVSAERAATLEVVFPAGLAPAAIALTPYEPSRSDFNYGVEVRAVRVRPAPPGPAPS